MAVSVGNDDERAAHVIIRLGLSTRASDDTSASSHCDQRGQQRGRHHRAQHLHRGQPPRRRNEQSKHAVAARAIIYPAGNHARKQ